MTEKLVLSYAKGITHSPSDLLCGDGELEECINLEVKNEELIPMEMPVRLPFELAPGEKLLLVHNTKTKDKNYVTLTDGVLRIFRANGDVKEYFDISLNCGELKSIQYLGNSIVAYTADSPHYILYSNGVYKYLGTKVPEVGLSFELSGDFVVSDTFKFTTPNTDSFEDEDFQREVSNILLAEVNKFVATKSIASGKFMFPFFVRYALKMYDGTYTHHSAPILMLPSTSIAPFVVSNAVMTGSNAVINKELDAQVGAFVAQLKAVVGRIEGSLSDWKDIVPSVDIFVSKQIYTYDQNGYRFYTSTWVDNPNEQSKFVGEYNGSSTIWDAWTQMQSKKTVDISSSYLHRWYIPRRTEEEVNSEITNTSLYYKFHSILVDKLTEGDNIEVTGDLNSLEVLETLSDDYMTHDTFVPESSFIYNGRLNISSIERKLFSGFPVQCMTQMVKEAPLDGFDYGMTYGTYEAYTYVKSPSGGSDIVVKSDVSTYGALYGTYLFYPDTDAYKMVIVDATNRRYAEVNLSEHPLINGSFAFIGFQTLPFVSGSITLDVTDNTEKQLNKLYVSDVNNPFRFPLEGIYTVGSDKIIGMGAVTRPISQGQFGEFPLIVFCSDGNYAMRVDEQGFYAAISPIQEDVVLGWDKITAMENSLVIITKKGIMLTTGGEMNKIAPQMEGGVLNVSDLNNIGTSIPELANLVSKGSDNAGFLSYVYGSRMAFDYASNRLLVYNPSKTYSYLYNFDNGTVSKIIINGGKKIISSVLDYPDTIVQDESGVLYSLYEKVDISMQESRQYGIALTRPLKLGAALAMKSIKQIIHLTSNHGNGSYVKYLLYGSNDNVTYYRISSRFGKPYKYYRVAIYTHLLPKESLSGTALTIEERRTHKYR